MNTKYYIYILLLIMVVLTSCNKQSLITIATNSPDMLFIAEAYNNVAIDSAVLLLYDEDISNILEQNVVDYVVSDTASQDKRDVIESLDIVPHIIEGENISLIKDVYNNMNLLSFSLPLVIIKKDSEHIDAKLEAHISLSQLQLKSTELLEQENIDYRLGFYPIQSEFVEVFTSNEEHDLWLNVASIDTQDITQYYNDHYAPAPLEEILLDDNIVYKFVSSYTFFTLDSAVQNEFEVYFLTLDSGQMPIISPIYIGQLNAREKVFLDWVYTLQAQKDIVTLKQSFYDNTHRSFVDNHFSAVWSLNEALIFSNDIWLWNNKPKFSHITIR